MEDRPWVEIQSVSKIHVIYKTDNRYIIRHGITSFHQKWEEKEGWPVNDFTFAFVSEPDSIALIRKPLLIKRYIFSLKSEEYLYTNNFLHNIYIKYFA